MTCGVLPGPYRVPGAYRAVCHFRLTNKTPAATYRAPGRFETTFVRERLVDAIAHQLGSIRIDVRRRNAVASDEMPYHAAAGGARRGNPFRFRRLSSRCSTSSLAQVEWDKLNAELARRRAGRRDWSASALRCSSRRAGLGPGRRRAHPGRHLRRGRGHHRRRLDRPGLRDRDGAGRGRDARRRLQARCASSTARPTASSYGIGAHASRATVMTASATHIAALKVRDEGARYGGRADAGAGRRARHRRRRGGASRAAPAGRR